MRSVILPAVVLLALPGAAAAVTPCTGGFAAGFPCHGIDLAANLGVTAMNGTEGNDIWGWTDPVTGVEYALMGLDTGTAFVDISTPDTPVMIGFLETPTLSSSWRDIKVYADHAYIVSEAQLSGMQVFDLNQLRDVSTPPESFTATANYIGFGKAHNIVINEESGFAYAVGTDNLTDGCSGGLHMIDLAIPQSPQFAGCYSGDGYTHDAQCVIYRGPDADYNDGMHEICFNYNEDTVTIVDVTNKASPVQIARAGYPGVDYSHQGWLTENQRYVIANDEGDEQSAGHNSRSYIWDMADLDAPVLIGLHDAATPAIDHNLYIRGNYMFQANYRAGVRIYDIGNIASATMSEHAYFDTYLANDSANFNGAWSVYPYFASGVIVVSDIEGGLFVLQPTNLGPDLDGDYVRDDQDNCTLVDNPDQRDTNADGYGNVCDGDLNNNGVVNFIDLSLIKAVFLSGDPDADLNGNGVVNVSDLAIMKSQFFGPPGPSGLVPSKK